MPLPFIKIILLNGQSDGTILTRQHSFDQIGVVVQRNNIRTGNRFESSKHYLEVPIIPMLLALVF